MSLIKRIITFCSILFLTSFSQLQAQEVKKIGKYKDWEAMVVSEASGKVCFAQSSPILQAPKSNKRDAKLFVAFRPNENITNEVSVTPGYEFNRSNSVNAASGKSKFNFDIKKRAPVLPAETIASALPDLTSCIAIPIDECLPFLKAILGFSFASIISSV